VIQMPADSRKIYATQRFRILKIASVPARYAYDWLTDYRTDDGKFSKSRSRHRVIRVGKDRVIRIRTPDPKSGLHAVAVDVVRLSPPNRWHLDQVDEGDLETVDYRVSSLGPHRSRVVVDIVERWMISNYPDLAEVRQRADAVWSRLVAALELDYRNGIPAKRR